MFLSLFSFRPLETEKQKNSDETTLEIDRRILRLKSRVWLINHSQFHKINIQGKEIPVSIQNGARFSIMMNPHNCKVRRKCSNKHKSENCKHNNNI